MAAGFYIRFCVGFPVVARDVSARLHEVDSLNDASLYLCTDARTAQGDLAGFLDRAYAGGVDIIQLRDKQLEASAELEALDLLRNTAQRHGKLWAANDRADIAQLSGSPVFHVGQRDLPVAKVRQLLPEATIGLSCHNASQLTAALSAPVDYFCVGPLWETPTKPGRAAVGLGLVEFAAAQHSSKPWFAIGGINLANLPQVIAAGASRVVVVRAITEAADPRAAAAEIKTLLTQAASQGAPVQMSVSTSLEPTRTARLAPTL